MKRTCRLYPCKGRPRDVPINVDDSENAMRSICATLGIKGFKNRDVQMESFHIEEFKTPRCHVILVFEAWEDMPEPLVYNKTIGFLPGNVMLCVEDSGGDVLDYTDVLTSEKADTLVQKWSNGMIQRQMSSSSDSSKR